MSFAGHALDAIIRIRNNRNLLQMHRARYNELKESINKLKAKYPHKFVDRNQLSEKELKKLKKKIHIQIINNRRKSFLLSILFTIIVCISIYFIVVYVFNYFYYS